MSDYQTPGTLAPNTQNLRRSVRAKAVWRRHAVRNGSLWWQTTCFKSEVCLWTKEEQCDTLLIARDLSCHQSWPFCQASWWHVTRRFGPQLFIKVLKLGMRSGKLTRLEKSSRQPAGTRHTDMLLCFPRNKTSNFHVCGLPSMSRFNPWNRPW